MRQTSTINTGWTFTVDADGRTALPEEAAALRNRRFSATVPGAVHVDLLREEAIVDPFIDDNETRVAWVGRTDWRFARTLTVPDKFRGHERVDLVFDGLDTVARVELGGVELGTTRNMHRSYRFNITELTELASAQELAVSFTSAYTEAESVRDQLGTRPNAYPEPFNYIRKMACSFGWDWGPTLVTAGIWRPVHLEAWSTARLANTRPLVDVVDGVGKLDLRAELDLTEQGREKPLRVEIALDGTVVAEQRLAAGATEVQMLADVQEPRLWFPRGYGKQELYELTVRLFHEGTLLDTQRRRIGFRSLILDRSFDETGSQFVFAVNGERIFAKGVNWIPDDIFPGTMTPSRYRHRLTEAADANVNMVRVWGGGIYEDDAFYDICDELGLLTWQDFLFACASYPEDEPIRGEVLAEARENVTRLSSHPSLVLWNGNNENLWLHEVTNWESQPGGQLSWGENYYLHLLKEIVSDVDPSRPYSDGSPWSGTWEHEPNDPDHQTFHSWDVWNREDYSNYRLSAPRFVSEFGWQAPPAWATLRRAVTDEPLLPTSPGVLHHQKAEDGNGKLDRGLALHYPQPQSTEAWHYLNLLNQVRAIETGVYHWRSHWPHTAGTIVWQLNDLWPVTSWSAIDGDGRHKPLYHALRTMYAERVVTLQPRGPHLVLVVINDCAERWEGPAQIRRIDGEGNVLASLDVSVSAAPRTVQEFPIPSYLTTFGEPTRELVIANFRGSRSIWYGTEPKDSTFPALSPLIEAVSIEGGLDVTVTARTLIRDLLVQADRIHPSATVDQGFITLLPGEAATFHVRSSYPLSAAALDAPYVLTHLDEVVAERESVVTLQ